MVINVTKTPSNMDEFVHNLNLQVHDIVHECEMNIMLEEYNYLCENGVIMEYELKNDSVVKFVKNAIATIFKKISDLYDSMINKLEEIKRSFKEKIKKFEANKAKEVEKKLDNEVKKRESLLKKLFDKFKTKHSKDSTMDDLNSAKDDFKEVSSASNEIVHDVVTGEDIIILDPSQHTVIE